MVVFVMALSMIVIVAVLMICSLYSVAAVRKKVKTISQSVRVKSKLTAYLSLFYTIIFGCQIIQNFIRAILNRTTDSAHPELQKAGYILLTIAWAVMFIYWFILSMREYVYVTPEEVIFGGGKRGSVSASDLSYRIEGDTLMIYREKFEHPTKYKIIEKKAELEEMLREHYISK